MCVSVRVHAYVFNVTFNASVAQLDVRPTSDQEIASSTPAVSATFFRGD